jgi:hypothetical protein
VWLNLSSGAVLCGRRQFDGSGGNGCALLHAGAAAAAGAPAPLVVKLGTVGVDWREGVLRADVYSYAERAAVLHPALAAHLACWGVDAGRPGQPAAPTVADLGADVNARHAAAVAAWYDIAVGEVPALLRGMSEDQRAHLMTLFVHASRAKFAAERAAAAAHAQPGAPQAQAQGEDADVALLAAQMAAMAAEQEAFDEAEAAAADEGASEDHDND